MRQRDDYCTYISEVLPYINNKSIEEISNDIHEVWMKQNIKHSNEDWCKNKFLPYDKLPEEDKDFDRDIAKILKSINTFTSPQSSPEKTSLANQ